MLKRLTFKRSSSSPVSEEAAGSAGHSNNDEVDREAFGLKQLTPGLNPTIDIVAVHGLNGHRERSWTADNKTNWLRDLLPEKVPGARIFTYGYDARTHAFETLSEQNLYDYGTALVAELSLKRRATKALIHANMCNKSHLLPHKNIHLSTYGVLFFGTPHQGGNGVSLGTLLANVASTFTKKNTKLLKHLEMHSELLLQQTTQYNAISGDFETKFFYEVYKTETPLGDLMIVPKYSAVIPGATNAEEIAINRDHRNMVKFGTADDSGFEKVSQHLEIMAEEAPARVAERWQRYYGTDSSLLGEMRLAFPDVPTADPSHNNIRNT